jgi:hypothetical protein
MVWIRRLAAIAIILFGLYALHSALTAISSEPTPVLDFYITVSIGLVWIGFSVLMLVSRILSFP